MWRRVEKLVVEKSEQKSPRWMTQFICLAKYLSCFPSFLPSLLPSLWGPEEGNGLSLGVFYRKENFA